MFIATSVLWTRVWNTKPDANETVAKGILKSVITADVNTGRLEYTLDEILALLEFAYGRAGSTNSASKAKQTWARYAKPGKEGWFAEI